MKSSLLSKAAAAALLVSAGAMFAAQPAFAEHRDGWSDRGHGYGHDNPDRDFRRDPRPPRIFDVTPDHGDQVSERGWTRISARFRDRHSGVASVSLRVDGRDVTGHARVDHDEIRYAENLRPGRHFAELVVRDRAGNTTRHAWSFDVLNDRPDRYGYEHRGHGYQNRW